MVERDGALEIGAAAESELAGVAALAGDSLREAWSEASFAATRAQPGGVILVARVSAGIAGFAAGLRVADELELYSVVVSTAWRRRGVGRALLLALGRDGSTIHLEVRASNTPALAFYRALGFEPVGRRVRYYADGEDALLLSRAGARSARAGGVR